MVCLSLYPDLASKISEKNEIDLSLEMSSLNEIFLCVDGLTFSIMRAVLRMTSDITNCKTFIKFIYIFTSIDLFRCSQML